MTNSELGSLLGTGAVNPLMFARVELVLLNAMPLTVPVCTMS
jgi:hypothetical protein